MTAMKVLACYFLASALCTAVYVVMDKARIRGRRPLAGTLERRK